MFLMTPPTRPKITRKECERIMAAKGVSGHAIVAVRGYYQDTMGERGKNDRGLYDDCLAVVSASVFKAFNGNTDPSTRKRGVAVLRPGVWLYERGIHGWSKPPSRRYEALVQAAKVTVERDDIGVESGFFGINVHRGGLFSPSSLGCVTVPPSQWEEFRGCVFGILARLGERTIPLVLITEEERRAIAMIEA